MSNSAPISLTESILDQYSPDQHLLFKDTKPIETNGYPDNYAHSGMGQWHCHVARTAKEVISDSTKYENDE